MASIVVTQIGIAAVALFISWFIIKCMSWNRAYRKKWDALSNFPCPKYHWLWGTSKELHEVGIDGAIGLMKKRLLHYKRYYLSCRSLFSPQLVLIHPEPVKQLLRTAEPKNRSVGGYKLLIPWIGDGLITSHGKHWERNRKLLTPGFHFNVLQPYMPTYNDAVEMFMKNISTRSSHSDSVEVFSLAALCTLDVVLRCAFSYNGGIQEEGEIHPYVKSVMNIAHLTAKRGIRPYLYPDIIYYLTADGREHKRLCNYVHEFADKIIEEREKTLLAHPESVKKRHLDFLDILLSARDEENKGLTKLEIRHEVDTFLFAGHDTTASAASWSLYALATNPAWQEKLREEVNAVLGERKNIEWDDIAKLKLTTMFLREAFRMYSPVPGVSRCLENPIVIDGIELPKGTLVAVSIYGLHHNDQVWDNPWEFRPERFSDDEFVGHDPYKFVPFSAGPRNCIGQNFALNEEKVLIARVVQKFHIEVDPNHTIVMVPMVVMRSKTGIRLKFTPVSKQ